LEKGEAVGIIGPSGAGKTTIVDLLLRLYSPSSGKILLDGAPIEEIQLSDWRRRVVYVPQDVFLLNGSVAENIKFFDESITDKEVEEAARRAHIYEFLASLPDGFASKAGERGSRFSGGERQRIALARALARKPSILILDEATSALDADAEAAIKETLKSLRGEVTLVVIAHKPSSIDYVDRLVAIRGGAVVEEGNPAELLSRKDSYFRRIYERGSALYDGL
jgi:ABC-type multidrug transport system fused ATPase/permease subunit